MQEPHIDFESEGGTPKLRQFLGLGYISWIQKILFSEKSGAIAPHDAAPVLFMKGPNSTLSEIDLMTVLILLIRDC